MRLQFLLIYIFLNLTFFSQSNISDSTVDLQPNNDQQKYNALISKEITIKELKQGEISNLGVAVAPSSMRFRTNPGNSETKILTITNDTYKKYRFKVTFSDIDMNREGTITGDKTSDIGLTNWIAAEPNFVEIEPGEKAKINITVNIPDTDAANRAAWCMGIIDEVQENTEIAKNENSESYTFGVKPSFGFAVYFYQNPPSVGVSEVEILDFSFSYSETNKYIHLLVKNIGKGIARAKAYVELDELNTGYHETLDLQIFNVLPNRQREFTFTLPGKMPKGKYSLMGILDFGSDEEIKAASKEIIIE